MRSPDRKIATLASLALLASSCGTPGGSSPGSQEAASGGDRQVVARRLADVSGYPQAVEAAPDGSFIASYRTTSGYLTLAIRDLTSGDVRDLTGDSTLWDLYPTDHAVSPDSRWIAFERSFPDPFENEKYELGVIRRDGTGERTLLTPFGSSNRGEWPVRWMDPLAWTHDSRSLLVLVWMWDGSSRLELASVEDGSGFILRAFDWRAPNGAAFSPDGRFLVYDFPPDEHARSTDLYVLALDGSRELRLTDDSDVKTVIGWSGDGSGIYYEVRSSDGQQDVSSVWRLPMRDARPAGPPTLVRGDLVNARSFDWMGDRVAYRQTSNPYAYWHVTVDLETGRVVAPPTRIGAPAMPPTRLDAVGWTRDGLEFWRIAPTPGTRTGVDLVLRSETSGEERRLPLGLDDVNGRMDLDERTMLLRGRRLNGAVMDVVRVDLSIGQVTPIQNEETLALFEGRGPPRFSPDLSIKYLQRLSGEVYEIVAQEVASGAERVLYRSIDRTRQLFAHGGPDGDLVLSPDGMQLAFVPYYHVRRPAPGEYNALLVLPVSGGDARIVHTGWVDGRSIQWTSDSRTLVFLGWADPDGTARGLRKVNADGTADALLLTWPGGIANPKLAPDDRRIVFRSGADPETRIDELRVLDNLQESRAGEPSGPSD